MGVVRSVHTQAGSTDILSLLLPSTCRAPSKPELSTTLSSPFFGDLSIFEQLLSSGSFLWQPKHIPMLTSPRLTK